MAHVSETDARAYRERRPDLEHVVVPNGGDIQPRTEWPDYASDKKNLLFFASLHGKMSFDALLHFAQNFWPALRDVSHMRVAGAHPSARITALCKRHGWEMRTNLTEEQVQQVFNETHFSVMPFSYGAGSKLKFFDACARGVPILSTPAGACGQELMPTFVTVSEEASAWRNTVLQTRALPDDVDEQVQRFGEQFSWTSIARRIVPVIQQRLVNAPTESGADERDGSKATTTKAAV